MDSIKRIYRIMVIDDEYNNNEPIYKKFLVRNIEGSNITFDIDVIEYGQDVRRKINLNIDAFIIDASLSDPKKGWGDPEFSTSFKTVLTYINNVFENTYIPPIFMVSKYWGDNKGLLTRVSKAFSDLKKPVYPVRYFELNYLQSIGDECDEITSEGKPNTIRLVEEREYILKEIEKALQYKAPAGEQIDIVVIVAVPDEETKAKKAFNISNKEIKKPLKQFGISYYTAKIGEYRVALVSQTNQGMTDAAFTSTSSIHAFKPSLIAMVGICAGKKDKTNLCDIIIPNDIFNYSVGKLHENDEIEFRAEHKQLNTDISRYIYDNIIPQRAALTARIKDDSDYTTAYKVLMELYSKPLATGTMVVNSPSVFDKISKNIQGDCIALDMEAYSVARSAEQLHTPWIVIKGVQDYADGQKEKDENGSRDLASYSSARLLYEIIPGLMKYLIGK